MADLRSQLPAEVCAYLDAVEEPLKSYKEATEKIADEHVTEQCNIFSDAILNVVPRYLLLSQSFSAPSPVSLFPNSLCQSLFNIAPKINGFLSLIYCSCFVILATGNKY